MSSIDDYCKINDKTLHLLPFVASRKRQKQFEIERQWGKWKLNLKAPETMNTLELITLSQLLQDYQRNPATWEDGGHIGDTVVLKKVLNISEMVKSRDLPDKKGNRETILNSIKRWYQAELKYTNLDDGTEVHSRYIYEFVNIDPKKITDVVIYVSKGFLEFCVTNGLMFHWKRLMAYKSGHAQLLDAFLQGTKAVSNGVGKKKIYTYRLAYSEDILFQALGLSDSGQVLKEQRRILKQAFNDISSIGKLPPYKLNSIYKRWVRSDLKLETK